MNKLFEYNYYINFLMFQQVLMSYCLMFKLIVLLSLLLLLLITSIITVLLYYYITILLVIQYDYTILLFCGGTVRRASVPLRPVAAAHRLLPLLLYIHVVFVFVFVFVFHYYYHYY